MVCQEFGIKLTSTVLSSDHSNQIGKRAGFEVDKILRYVNPANGVRISLFSANISITFDFELHYNIRETHPELNLLPLKSKIITIMSKER